MRFTGVQPARVPALAAAAWGLVLAVSPSESAGLSAFRLLVWSLRFYDYVKMNVYRLSAQITGKCPLAQSLLPHMLASNRLRIVRC